MTVASPETRAYQRAQVALRAVVYSDVSALWRLLQYDTLDQSFPLFAAAAISLIEGRRVKSAALARAYLRARRRGVEGLAPEVATPQLDRAAALVSLRVTTAIGIKSATAIGTDRDLALRNALVRTMGVVDKYVGDAGRELIRQSVEADPSAKGWVRRTLGTCDYCAEKAAGAHVESGSADFPRHDHCGCQPEPVYEGKPALKAEEPYVEKILAALRADKTTATTDQLQAVLADASTKPLSRVNIEEALARYASEQAEKAAAATDFSAGALRAPRAIPDEVLDALRPRGGWDARTTRNRTVAALKETPEGRLLLKQLDSFQSGGSTAIPRLRTDIEAYLRGETLPQGRVDTIETLLSAINRSKSERVLHRGMSIPGTVDDMLARYKTGDSLDLSLSSFSSDKKLASSFADRGAGKRVTAKVRTRVMVELEPGARALPIERLSKSGIFADEKEWLASGRFHITEVRHVRRAGVETVVLKVKQVAGW